MVINLPLVFLVVVLPPFGFWTDSPFSFIWKQKRIKIWYESIFIFRRTARYAHFYHKRNEEILEELKVETTDENLRRYKSNRLRHLIRMNNNRIPKIMLGYRPNGRRRLRRHLRKLFEEVKQVHQGLTRDG